MATNFMKQLRPLELIIRVTTRSKLKLQVRQVEMSQHQSDSEMSSIPTIMEPNYKKWTAITSKEEYRVEGDLLVNKVLYQVNKEESLNISWESQVNRN